MNINNSREKLDLDDEMTNYLLNNRFQKVDPNLVECVNKAIEKGKKIKLSASKASVNLEIS